MSSSGTSSSSSSSSSLPYPGPEPPVILPENYNDDGRPSSSSRAFLSSTPATDSSIEVHTKQHEYQLLVRLPGFNFDSITLATKRKRILHVVADRWENGGGHFERRIAFGYDADLNHVKAAFDGEMLRISIPRRISPVTIHSQTRITPIGRSS
ncbi:hypothetical protein B0H34DRAFT_697904 [Crassisporium funariophilum]|nr:hypothetical protein B0H34DRAFT_697904 [Crassisporium funariophilum]